MHADCVRLHLIAPDCLGRYDNRLISYEDRLRSYMKTFYERSVDSKVAKFVNMGNVRRPRRARLLGALRTSEGPLTTPDYV